MQNKNTGYDVCVITAFVSVDADPPTYMGFGIPMPAQVYSCSGKQAFKVSDEALCDLSPPKIENFTLSHTKALMLPFSSTNALENETINVDS